MFALLGMVFYYRNFVAGLPYNHDRPSVGEEEEEQPYTITGVIVAANS